MNEISVSIEDPLVIDMEALSDKSYSLSEWMCDEGGSYDWRTVCRSRFFGRNRGLSVASWR